MFFSRSPAANFVHLCCESARHFVRKTCTYLLLPVTDSESDFKVGNSRCVLFTILYGYWYKNCLTVSIAKFPLVPLFIFVAFSGKDGWKQWYAEKLHFASFSYLIIRTFVLQMTCLCTHNVIASFLITPDNQHLIDRPFRRRLQSNLKRQHYFNKKGCFSMNFII